MAALGYTLNAYTDEQARDAVANALRAGSNISITVNDAADTITISASGATPANNSVTDAKVATNAQISADKLADSTSFKIMTAAERIRLAAMADGATAYTDEAARDAVAAALVAGSNITITVDDAANTITIASAGVGGGVTPADNSVTDVKVASNAAINADKLADGTTNKVLTATERTKLAGIASGANAYTDEQVQDATAAMFAAGTHTGVTVTYNDAGNSMSVATIDTITANTQTGTAYTLVLADGGKAVEMNNASANTITIPPNSSVAFPIGAVIEVCQYGAGTTTIAAGAGVTVRTASTLVLRTQYATASARKRATDEWVVAGDLA